jgi:hypothetical protein
MTNTHISGGWLVAVTLPGGDKTLYHAAIADPKEAAARVLKVAGADGTADAVGRLSKGQVEDLGMKHGEIKSFMP